MKWGSLDILQCMESPITNWGSFFVSQSWAISVTK